MTTSNEILDQINKALNDAFRKTETLRRELLPKLDKNIKNNIGQIELNNMVMVVRELIDNFDRKGFLDELVIAAIRANPNNSELVKLRARMDDINPELRTHKLSENFLQLWSIISRIKRTNIISECLNIFKVLESAPDEKSDLENKFNDVKDIDEIFHYVLRKFLLVERENLNDGTKTVLSFAQYLADNKDVESSVKQELNNWISRIKKEYNLHINSVSHDAKPYLLIIISPEYNSFRVYAYLLLDYQNPQDINIIDIEYKSDEIALEAGIKFDSFHEIKNEVINNFIVKSEDRLHGLKINKQLIIEFFLPVQHFHEKIEQWELLDCWENRKKLGHEYGVVVRSYDLFQNRKLRKALRLLNDNRQRFNSLLPLKNDDIKAEIHHIDRLDCYFKDWDKLRFQLEKKIGLNLICAVPENDKIRMKIFQSIIDSGIIIVIWKTPNTSGSSSNLKIDEFLNLNSLTNLNNLFIDVKEKRRENYDIFLLCEEPHLNDLSLFPMITSE